MQHYRNQQEMLKLNHVFSYLFVQVTLVTTFALVFLIICRDGAYHFQGIDRVADARLPSALFTRMYFSLVASSTTGFGDIAPKSTIARLLTMLIILSAAGNMASVLVKSVMPTMRLA